MRMDIYVCSFSWGRMWGSVFYFQLELSHACHIFFLKKVHMTHTQVKKKNEPGKSSAKEKGPSSLPTSFT